MYIEEQLKLFRSGDRKNDIMFAIADRMSDADIKAPASRFLRTARFDAFRRQPADVHLRGESGRDRVAAEPLVEQLHRPVRAVLVRGVRQVLDLARLQQLVVPGDHGIPGRVDLGLPDPQRAQDAAGCAFVSRTRAGQQPAGFSAPRGNRSPHRRAADCGRPEVPLGTHGLRGAATHGQRRRDAGGQERQCQSAGLCVRACGDGHHLHRRPAGQRTACAPASDAGRQEAHRREHADLGSAGKRPPVGRQPKLSRQRAGARRRPGQHGGRDGGRRRPGAADALHVEAQEVRRRLLLHGHAQPLSERS
ncbi:hypothetical protein G6F22_013532 [Rhizopus arrhizus]|nr:hypothetical protein G6F22_013532 [Rhizopus arrhizus]